MSLFLRLLWQRGPAGVQPRLERRRKGALIGRREVLPGGPRPDAVGCCQPRIGTVNGVVPVVVVAHQIHPCSPPLYAKDLVADRTSHGSPPPLPPHETRPTPLFHELL
jgi:hypothetical protein